MVKYFDKDCKMNWVDSNNVFVGFDDEGSCCEVWGAGFYSSLNKKAKKLDVDLSVDNNWVFDTSFYMKDMDKKFTMRIDGYEEADRAAFRLIDGNKEMFLVIWNEHNGYYCHGFEFCNGDTVIVTGSI